MPIRVSGINKGKLSWLSSQPIDVKVELLKNHIEIIRLLVNEIIEEEVFQLAGERYSRDKPHGGRYSRWGFNPGSVYIGDEKVPLDVPRVHDNQTGASVSLENYQQLQAARSISNRLFNAMLKGLSTRDYKGIIREFEDSFGLSHSSVSRRFIERSQERLDEFLQRDLSGHEIVALFIDGKYLAGEQIVIVLGVTGTGEKIPLGFAQTHTENATSIKQLLSGLVDRGLKYEDGLLTVIDGSKGLGKAVKDAFGNSAVIQRCQWHKRENVVGYLNEADQDRYRRKLNAAYRAETYAEAKAKLEQIRAELALINMSAARSLDEGLEETLTLHRLGLNEIFGRSFSTTNCIENLNSQLLKYVGKIKFWKNATQRERWVACGLMEIELKMKKVYNHRKLNLMKDKIKEEVAKNLKS